MAEGSADEGVTAGPSVATHAIVVPRTARYCTIGPTHGFPRELWFVCHGYGQLAPRFIREFASLDDGSRLIVAPEGLSRFYLDPIPKRRHDPSPRVGETWMKREARESEIADYVSYLDRVADEVRHSLTGAAPRIVVLGFSQGTATVCRWLASSAMRADQLVLWSGTIPPELDLAAWADRLHGATITLVAGERDEMVPATVMSGEAERLSAAGVAFTLERHAGAHEVTAAGLKSLLGEA